MTLEEENEAWESYLIPGTNVLKNKFNISNREELLQKEVEVSFLRNVELMENPISMDFDKEHLKAIHRYLFGDIYDFAGNYRTCYMQKNHSYFSPVEDIDSRLDYCFMVASQELKENVSSKMDFAIHLSSLFCELLNIHPFREGNGRSVREFIREYANAKSQDLPFGPLEFNWDNVSRDTLNEVIGFSAAFRSAIDYEFFKALEPVKINQL